MFSVGLKLVEKRLPVGPYRSWLRCAVSKPARKNYITKLHYKNVALGLRNGFSPQRKTEIHTTFLFLPSKNWSKGGDFSAKRRAHEFTDMEEMDIALMLYMQMPLVFPKDS